MRKRSPLQAPISAVEKQGETYFRGLSGLQSKIPFSLKELEIQAKEKMSKAAFAYAAGGAGLEKTMDSNERDFDAWKIIPRMLRDVSQYDMSIELFGKKLPSPLLLSPIGVLELAHKSADIGVARAASSLGIPMIFSNQASTPMEQCAKELGDSPKWFQLYWSKSKRLVASLVKRAEACGCEAIVVTLDTTMLGWRIRDLELAYLPFLKGMGIAQYTSDPVFQELIDEPDDNDLSRRKTTATLNTLISIGQLMRRYPGNFFQNLRSGRPLKAVRKFINLYTNPALKWEDLSFLKEQTNLPILLKGILHPEDAKKALAFEVDGIIVSNHGGRQVDGSISSIEALPDIVKEIDGRIPVLMDSGIRSGADIFKALALGAKAVCIGRPYVYGLALGGEAGVYSVLSNFLAEFELTMRLSGCKSIEEIIPSLLLNQRKQH